jgi:hypothetical protein
MVGGAMKPDFVVYSKDKTPQLLVEVTNKSRRSAEWAANFRRHIMSHFDVEHAPYFLLVLPDKLYLWKDGDSLELVAPDYEVKTKDLFAHRLNKHVSAGMSEYSLEILLSYWLNLISSRELEPSEEPAGSWLIESGLHGAIKGGTVVQQPSEI